MNLTKTGVIAFSGALLFVGMFSCQSPDKQAQGEDNGSFKVQAGEFADLGILRYQVPGWDQLSLDQKKLAYYLSQAGLAGRDIIYDQRGKYNLTIRRTLEAIWNNPETDKSGEEWER
ncbi:MAG TPA: dihydrofolate reductase, partial [Anseongella sp.]